jgi:hypothetical protein
MKKMFIISSFSSQSGYHQEKQTTIAGEGSGKNNHYILLVGL